MTAVLDTNILIDYLNGIPEAREEIGRYSLVLISRVTWMEVLAGAVHTEAEKPIRAFLSGFKVREITSDVAESAVDIRRRFRMRLPDAIILATAQVEQSLLVTRNTKDFDPAWAQVRVPYCL